MLVSNGGLWHSDIVKETEFAHSHVVALLSGLNSKFSDTGSRYKQLFTYYNCISSLKTRSDQNLHKDSVKRKDDQDRNLHE